MTSKPDHELVAAVRRGLEDLGDADKAQEMRRYMKSTMPFRGVQKPARERLARRLFAQHPLPDVDSWLATVLELWRDAEYREERYLAIDLTGQPRYAGWQDSSLLPLYEELIVTGAWWDFVDELAARRIGPLLLADQDTLTPVMLAWARGEDRWKRRTAVICQLGAKKKTDTGLLAECVEATVDDPDFFLRKGIGWALRQYSKTDPGWVRDFVTAHPALSPLSRREASKYL